jgi:hypothetical protein
MATTSTTERTSQTSRMSLAIESRAGARSPLRKVATETTTSEASSGHSALAPPMPTVLNTASSAISCTAM